MLLAVETVVLQRDGPWDMLWTCRAVAAALHCAEHATMHRRFTGEKRSRRVMSLSRTALTSSRPTMQTPRQTSAPCGSRSHAWGGSDPRRPQLAAAAPITPAPQDSATWDCGRWPHACAMAAKCLI
jgi:hypothetical protein